MKKIIHFLLFLAFLALFSAKTFATNYDLIIAGVAITDANKNNITAAVNSSYNGTASGTITYDPTSNILTLNGASIRVITPYCIFNSISNLTIQLIGSNTITAKVYGIYSTLANFTINGSGSLTINADTIAIEHSGCNLTIDNTTLTAKGGQYGIKGYDGLDEVLTINSSTVKATGTNKGSICDLKNLILNDSRITQPAASAFNASQKAICLNGNIVKTEVVIEPVIYDLWVAGVQVTGVNRNNITAAVEAAGGRTVSGVITYDPTSNTLTLDNMEINYGSAQAIKHSIANLTIDLIGENTLTSPAGDAMIFSGNTTITGSGSLTANAGRAAIWHNEDTLIIDNTIITLNGGNQGISGDNNEIIIINNSSVSATGTNDGSISKISELILNGCKITQPIGAAFNASQKAVCLNSEKVKTEVVIVPAYDLWVAGVQVTEVNKDSITAAVEAAGGRTVSGVITYDPTSNTLTLANMEINYESSQAIKHSIANLTIDLIGENTLTSPAGDAMIFSGNTTITGSGSLTANAGRAAIWQNEDTLIIDNTIITLNGGNQGISGDNNETIIINNSTVNATGTNHGSISKISNLILNDCEIIEPETATFDASQKAVCLNGEIVKTEIVIEPTVQTTYTVSGTVLDNENAPLANVEITYNGGTTTTAADGRYSFTAEANTNYTITPTLADYSFEPATATVEVVEADVTGIDFVGIANAAVIDPITTGVKETIADNVKIRMQNRQLTIENSDRQAIAVYNIMGQVIVTKLNPNNTETFTLPTAGVYIVKVGKSTTKVVAQ